MLRSPLSVLYVIVFVLLAACSSGSGTTPGSASDAQVSPDGSDAAADTTLDVPSAPDRAVPDDAFGLDLPADEAVPVDVPADLTDAPATTDAGDAGCPAGQTYCGGRCLDLASDPTNCGVCGMNCRTLAGVDPDHVVCAAGRCVLDRACLAERGDCDGDATTGCEADLTTATNCGRCSAACSGATSMCAMVSGDGGATRTCTSGCTSTTPTRCGSACVDTMSDTANCGGCARACPTPSNARATCSEGRCDFVCNAGFHLCGGRCVSNMSTSSCGTSCTPCEEPLFDGVATCDGTRCGIECVPMRHLCGTLCVRNDVVESCGSSCTPCTAPPNAVALCSGGRCTFACQTVFHLCGDTCVSDNDVRTCGSACTPCPTASGGHAVCTGTRCVTICDTGFHACGDTCAANTAPASCGTSCTPCPAPANGRATCDGTSCGIVCDAGFDLAGSACVLTTPQLIAPPSTATSTSRRPQLRWTLPTAAPVTVRLCRDRALTLSCTTIASTTLTASPASELAPGPWFWRVERSMGSTMLMSATWEFFVGVRSAPVVAAWGTVPDFNGDGLADIIVGSESAAPVAVYHGRTGGPATTPSYALNDSRSAGDGYGNAVASAGDINGDGFGDAIVGAAGAIYLYLGGTSGLARSYTQRATGDVLFGLTVASAGDINGDGYGDVVAGYENVGAYLYYGGPSGLRSGPPLTLAAPSSSYRYGLSFAAVDMNADGFSDLAVGAPSLGSSFTRPMIFIYRGDASGIIMTPTTIVGAPYSYLGRFVDNAGDLNGDGYGDLIASARNVAQEAKIYLGGPTIPTMPTSTISYGSTDFAVVVAGAGDVDADGYSDIVGTGIGAAYLHLGIPEGISGGACCTVTGPRYFGLSAAGAGDVNGDGFADVLVGGEDFARLYLGSAAGIGASVIEFRPASSGHGFGWTVAGLDVEAAGRRRSRGRKGSRQFA